jgi:hypothetical protein
MGLEIRKVPEGWEHPEEDNYERNHTVLAYRPDKEHRVFRPILDQSWRSAYLEWWQARIVHLLLKPLGTALALLGLVDPTQYRFSGIQQLGKYVRRDFDEWWGKKPEPYNYRPNWPKRKRTHLQLYQTVSEGTPLSPPMPDAEALAHWLTEHTANVWVGTEEMTYEDWMRFMENGGYAMSAVISDGKFYSGVKWASRETKST